MSTFSADDISGPVHMAGTAKYYFAVALPGGGEGHAVVVVGDAGVQTDEHERRDRVAAALNSQVQASGDDAVVDALKSADGLALSLTGF